jgi:hypothetical protein
MVAAFVVGAVDAMVEVKDAADLSVVVVVVAVGFEP